MIDFNECVRISWDFSGLAVIFDWVEIFLFGGVLDIHWGLGAVLQGFLWGCLDFTGRIWNFQHSIHRRCWCSFTGSSQYSGFFRIFHFFLDLLQEQTAILKRFIVHFLSSFSCKSCSSNRSWLGSRSWTDLFFVKLHLQLAFLPFAADDFIPLLPQQLPPPLHFRRIGSRVSLVFLHCKAEHKNISIEPVAPGVSNQR